MGQSDQETTAMTMPYAMELFAHVISCSMYRPCAGAGVTSVYKTEGPAAELFVTVVDSE